MNTTNTVKVSLTLKADVYGLLEEMCRADERRSINRQISWLIRQYAAPKTSTPDMAAGASGVMRNGNIIYPEWK
jgi:hypothetical protein